MTKSNIGKVFIGMVLLVGAAKAGQGQFARESTLVPAGPDEVALGIQTLRVHAPVGSGNVTTTRVEIINAEQKVIGHLIDVKSAVPAGRGNAPDELIELVFQNRKVSVHFKDRALWISDGVTSVAASFDRRSAEDAEAVRGFADDLRLIAGIQIAAKPVTLQAAAVAPTKESGILSGLGLPSFFTGAAGTPPKDSEPVCHTEPAHAKCAGGFGASRSSGCAWAQQQANNECAEASGYCIGCCAWVGTGCDCACLFDDLACMCDVCGGLCGPAANAPSPVPANATAK
jgi:hypothetical protein